MIYSSEEKPQNKRKKLKKEGLKRKKTSKKKAKKGEASFFALNMVKIGILFSVLVLDLMAQSGSCNLLKSTRKLCSGTTYRNPRSAPLTYGPMPCAKTRKTNIIKKTQLNNSSHN
jgi:hypothetical protein